jgi:hypothetical protein
VIPLLSGEDFDGVSKLKIVFFALRVMTPIPDKG